MTNIDTFRQFCKDVASGTIPAVTRCTALTPKEVLELGDCASKAQQWLDTKGIVSKMSGVGNIVENGFSFRAGQYTFTVLPPGKAKKQPVKKGVAASSIEMYHSLDTRVQVTQVAITAASLTKKHGFTTDNQVAQFVGIPAARVSARRTEIEKLQGVILASVPHYFETAGRVVCPVTGNSVNGWRVIAAGQASLFQ